MQFKAKTKWGNCAMVGATFLCYSCFSALLCGIFVYYIDPFFHFHKPQLGLQYTLKTENQRYQNDGIIRNFEYDAIIIGTSLSEFFKTSEMDEVFGCKSIKVPYSGGSYREISRNIEKALDTHDVKLVVRPLDFNNRLIADKDSESYVSMPVFLYDNNPFNDVEYLFNKSVIVNECFDIVKKTITSGQSGITSFDDYCNWEYSHEFGKKPVADSIGGERDFVSCGEIIHLTSEDADLLIENVNYNLVQLAKKHPDTQFYYFFPPQSIVRWGMYNEEGTIERRLEAEQLAIELMLDEDNIHLFSFSDCFGWTTDLNCYCDATHYASWIDSDILRLMVKDDGRLTKENYLEHIRSEREFYSTYSYDSIFN